MGTNPNRRPRRRSLAVGLTVLFCWLTVGAAAQDVPPAPNSSAPEPQAIVPGSARHLDDAAAVIKTVSDSSLNSDGRKRLAELQRHFAELVEAYKKSPDAFANPSVGDDSDGDADKDHRDRADVNWKELFTLVENNLTDILGAGSALPEGSATGTSPAIAVNTGEPRGGAAVSTTGQLPQASPSSIPQSAATPGSSAATPDAQATSTMPTAGANTTAPPAGAVATAGAAPSTSTINGGLIAGAIGVKNLDPKVRRQLEEFRLHVELFFAASTMNLEGETTR